MQSTLFWEFRHGSECQNHHQGSFNLIFLRLISKSFWWVLSIGAFLCRCLFAKHILCFAQKHMQPLIHLWSLEEKLTKARLHFASKLYALSEVRNIAPNHIRVFAYTNTSASYSTQFLCIMSSTFGRLAHAMKIINCKDSITGKKKKKEIFFLFEDHQEQQTTKNLHCTLLHCSFDLMSLVHGQVYNPT